jgi:hypothetical protein
VGANINGVLGIAPLKRVVNRDDLDVDRLKRSCQDPSVVVVGRVVGPRCEHSAGMKEMGDGTRAIEAVETRVTWVQQVARRVVDVDADRVEPAAGQV